MTLKLRLLSFSVFALALTALGTTLSTIITQQPSSHRALAWFYAGLVGFVCGLAYFICFFVNYRRHLVAPTIHQAIRYLRYGLIVGLVISLILALKAARQLNLPAALAILGCGVVAELFCRRQRTRLR